MYRTGQPYHGAEVQALSDRPNTGRLETSYFIIILQATHGGAGRITGVIAFAYDVTELVRRQLATFNQALKQRVQALPQALGAALRDAEPQRAQLAEQ